jgi:acyl-CoA dehydrogenase
MSERDLIVETVKDVLQHGCTPQQVAAAEGSWLPALWDTLAEVGVAWIAVPEESGGAGGSIGDAVAVVRAAAEFAAPIPLAETMVASRVLAAAGLAFSTEPSTFALARGSITRSDRGYRITATLWRVPWAAIAATLVLVDEDNELIAAVPLAGCVVTNGRSLAGEPRDDVVIDVVLGDDLVASIPSRVADADVYRFAALLRAAQIAGALGRILALTAEYVGQREQFGQAIVSFQAVQQLLAELAAEVVAVGVAVDAAAVAYEAVNGAFAVEAAKTYASASSGRAAAIAHQLHGAVGFTEEHQLHLLTRRLWCWRDENGNETYWGAKLAERATAAGADELWSLVTSSEAA